MAAHWGRHQTQEIVSRNYEKDKWSEDVARCVAGCVKCQKSNTDRNSRQTKLVPMLREERPFEEIVMDFVAELLESEACNTILVVID